ncbi:hydantoinase/oxoprolinase N-terminal domain-containing protein [Hyphomicrobium sp. MC1]|uniref:hydantoinase/oxoprolinase N-terminal domain-containing protein n=1 Tax=Hyphomicrobium sp. (strain MC1) TaxID=717785 RepID=UPI000213EFE9|nr:hydantoinase/oxoprolinase family protein [Hyphomicrobium sp. MC1]CCB66694.1 Hydantoinase beta subunit-like protein [Hyphomicrobium sp. MC1]
MSRIGIDVGGTNTDAVLIEAGQVLAAVKSPTTANVADGVRQALASLMVKVAPLPASRRIKAVMIGTTHFTNAVIERRDLDKVAALRIGLPANAGLPPFIGWPPDLVAAMRGSVHMVRGGHEYDGRRLVPLDRAAVRAEACRIADAGLSAVAITSVFSPLTDECEREAAQIVREEVPGARITSSHEIGQIGLLERENIALLNAGLQSLARRTTKAFAEAAAASGIHAPLFLTQNDGTIVQSAIAEYRPVYCFASGPTNSMRGAAFLSGITDALVVDVGGTTTDVGCLKAGFPRQANAAVELGGVRTLFRMPDLLSIGLGGGTEISPDGRRIGPGSVGFRLSEKALVFGGDTLTISDLAVAAGRLDLGDRAKLAGLSPTFVAQGLARAERMIADLVDRIRADAALLPLLTVGGGSFLVPDHIPGVSQVVRIEHHAVANAVGAAIAQVSGEVDHVFTGMERGEALGQAQAEAMRRAIEAGAEQSTLRTLEVEDLPIAYLPGNARRVRVRVVGDISVPSSDQAGP